MILMCKKIKRYGENNLNRITNILFLSIINNYVVILYFLNI